MNVSPPLNTTDDLRRLALNAGTYGMITVPAKALLDLLGSAGDLFDSVELAEALDAAEQARRAASQAVTDAEMAAERLEDLLEKTRGKS